MTEFPKSLLFLQLNIECVHVHYKEREKQDDLWLDFTSFFFLNIWMEFPTWLWILRWLKWNTFAKFHVFIRQGWHFNSEVTSGSFVAIILSILLLVGSHSFSGSAKTAAHADDLPRDDFLVFQCILFACRIFIEIYASLSRVQRCRYRISLSDYSARLCVAIWAENGFSTRRTLHSEYWYKLYKTWNDWSDVG